VQVENQKTNKFIDFGTPASLTEIENSNINEVKVISLEKRCVNDGINVERVLKHFSVTNLEDLTEKQLSILNQYWDSFKEA
jgi:hypothetical protein